MPTLIQRIKQQSEGFDGHSFPAVVGAYCRGHIPQGKAYTTLNIGGTAQTRLDQQAEFEQFKVAYDSKNNAQQKDFLMDVLFLTQLLQEDDPITKENFNSSLGLALDTT